MSVELAHSTDSEKVIDMQNEIDGLTTIRSFEQVILARMHDLGWMIPTQDTGVCVVFLKPWGDDKAMAAAKANGREWNGPPAALAALADVLVEANITYYGSPRCMLVLRAKGDLSDQPSTRLQNLETAMWGILIDGMPDTGPFYWSLFSKKDLQVILNHSIHSTGRRCLQLRSLAVWVFCLLLKDPIVPYLNTLRDQVSPAVAYASAYHFLFVQMMWVLAGMTILAEALGDNAHDSESARRAVWEIFKVALLAWGVLLLARSWKRTQLVELGVQFNMRDTAPPHKGLNRQVASRCQRIMRSVWAWLMTLTGTALNVFIIFYYVQLNAWLAFTWGDCIKLECHDPEVKHGFLGWLVVVISDIVQALLWLAVLELSKAMGAVVVKRKAYNDEEERKRALLGHTLFMEAFGKILPLAFVGIFFVPDYSTIGGPNVSATSCQGDDFSLWLKPDYMLCLARHMPLATRQEHFRRMFNGPFMVAPYVQILMKVIVPMAALFLDCMARTFPRCRCCSLWISYPFRAIARLLALIFTFECDSVGCSKYIAFGKPFGKPEITGGIYKNTMGKRSTLRAVAKSNEDGKSAPALPDTVPAEREPTNAPKIDDVGAGNGGNGASDEELVTVGEKCCEAALQQGSRKTFDSFDEMLEVNLFFLFVMFFAPVKPMGVLGILGARLLETQTDLAKLLFIRCRPRPRGTETPHKMRVMFSVCVLVASAVWSAVLSTVVFQRDFAW